LKNISVLAIDPGKCASTSIVRTENVMMRIGMMTFIPMIDFFARHIHPDGPFRTKEKVADEMLFVAFNEIRLGKHPRALLIDGIKLREPKDEIKDERKQTQLWKGSLKLAGLRSGDTVLSNWQ
jgi:hypothetical protein